MTGSSPQLERVREHLEAEYEGVFSPGQVGRHVEEYVALDPALELVDVVLRRVEPGAHVLDVGCGYGSFVTVSREAGLDAIGIDTAEFEIEFARRRLAERRPEDDAEAVFRVGNGLGLEAGEESVDAVTLWNVIEHVPDYAALLAECGRVLRPGGWLFAIAPNYASFRREAHYHVPWVPRLPRPLASRYLSSLGRDPRFYETSIFECTNVGVRRRLRDLGFDLVDPRVERIANPSQIRSRGLRAGVRAATRLRIEGAPVAIARALASNPLRRTINIEARKRLPAAG